MSDAVIEQAPKPLVLIVDDSKLVRVSLNRALRKEFQILEAVDGEDAWEQLVNNENIQVVITDAGMPRLDGYELIQRIRSQEQNWLREIPILMITGAEKAQTEVREQALALGASDFITKPFDNVQLLARTRSYIKLDTTARNLDATSKDLKEQAILDPLTKLYNFRYFLEQVTQTLAFAHRHSQAVSFVAVAIDNIEAFKAEHGDEKATQLQVLVASAIKPILRKEDVVARIEDGYYTVLAPFISEKDATSLAGRIQHLVNSQQFLDANNGIAITLSIGISSLGEKDLTTAQHFLDTLEKRVKQVQQAGGNSIQASAQATEKSAKHVKVSVDTALKILEEGNIQALDNYLPALALRILPILELCNNKLNWQLDNQVEEIKNKINN